eukprot:TRINITY_DN2723_c0_g1_i1.p1 TRINITY_DN2723_c0_g1~~TRINITY_DN2723_c0_g1_i1.p1  ORF type:complete len:557 (+),score=33.42 TRINITY_DN2723_c0_g1_i1:167-1837(+)
MAQKQGQRLYKGCKHLELLQISPMQSKRGAGVLAHITSLPSKYGIGDMGRECTNPFINFLRSIDHSLWSFLPLGPPDGSYCPYCPRSTFAGNHMIIAVDELPGDIVLEEYHEENYDPRKVNFPFVDAYKRKALLASYNKTKGKLGPDYESFKKEELWLEDYAVFMAAGEAHGGNYNWSTWEPEGLRKHEPKAIAEFKSKHADAVEFHCFVQYIFFKQLADLKRRANEYGVSLLGDLPYYMSYESSDVWANRDIFAIDPNTLKITVCSGCAPDRPTMIGQWWGHPVFRWRENQKRVLNWWVLRLAHQTKYCDQLRIDHAIGLMSICELPYKENPSTEERIQLAAQGKWHDVPGTELLYDKRLDRALKHIFLEDRGHEIEIKKVKHLRKQLNIPGMAFLQDIFGLDARKEFAPYKQGRDCFFYIGSHDDHPVRDFIKFSPPDVVFEMKHYLGVKDTADLYEALMRELYSSVADNVVVQLQDIIPYREGSRMNIPGIPTGQWGWRFTFDDLRETSVDAVNLFKTMVEIYERKQPALTQLLLLILRFCVATQILAHAIAI